MSIFTIEALRLILASPNGVPYFLPYLGFTYDRVRSSMVTM